VTAGSAVLRTCAFAELATGVWGAVWALDAPGGAFVALGDRSNATAVAAALDGADSGADWVLAGEGVQLTVSGRPQAAAAGDVDGGGFEQLCRVCGRVELADARRDLASVGYRAVRNLADPLDRCDSIRAVAALFEPDEAIGLFAVRPRRAKGHETDAINAALIEQEGAVSVADPRLSTTYADGGRPMRAALELWVKDEQGEDRLRRAAGEALGVHATGTIGDLRARAELFAWHSRGRDGLGTYLLAQRP
jgi:hypothetical protein